MAGLLTHMRKGAEFVTLSPLEGLPPTKDDVNEARVRSGLPTSENASFYKMKEFSDIEKGHGFLSFTDEPFTIYKYTKIQEDAMFLCSNRNCKYAQNNTAIPAFEIVMVEENGKTRELLFPVWQCPECSSSTRSLRPKRRKVDYAYYS
jgi:hypothetical protein